jgi:dolichyl-phosphate-mannose--protein O-mannosyl transferase
MSITIRLWDDKTLESIKNRTADNHLITTFMNVKTFGKNEIKVYPYDIRKIYIAWADNQEDVIRFYAVNDESALWFLDQEYNTSWIVEVDEEITDYRMVNIPERSK